MRGFVWQIRESLRPSSTRTKEGHFIPMAHSRYCASNMSFCDFLNGRRKVKDIQPLKVTLALIFGRDITKTRDNHNNESPTPGVAQEVDVLR